MRISQRHLPHWYAIGQPLFITFRLHGSLPGGRGFPPESITSGEAFLCVDRLLDAARIGPTYLAMPSLAQVVVDSLQHCSETDYTLHAWVIMPNHVHMLATTRTDVSEFMRRLKEYTARRTTNCSSVRSNHSGRRRVTIIWSARRLELWRSSVGRAHTPGRAGATPARFARKRGLSSPARMQAAFWPGADSGGLGSPPQVWRPALLYSIPICARR